MDNPIVIGLAVVALLSFWVLGAYNRLVELRNAAADAWAQAAEAQRRRAEAVAALVQALRAPLAPEAASLDALAAAQEQAAQAAARMSARPLRPEHAAAWVAAEAGLLAAAARVFALVESAGAPAALEPVRSASATWHESMQRLHHTRQLFNDAAAAHDEALGVFPTSMLVGLFGFAPAGRV